jgi:hypothetical protein
MWIISSMFLVKNVVKSTHYISKHKIVKKIHMKAWSYQDEMDFQWLKMRNKIRNNFHINFLKSSFLALEIFQCILLLNFWFDDALCFYFYFDIIMSYVLNPHVDYICMIKKKMLSF